MYTDTHTRTYALNSRGYHVICIIDISIIIFKKVCRCFFVVPGLDVPLDLTVTASTDNTITLVWGMVQGPIDFYKVTFTSSSGLTTEVNGGTHF